MAILVTGATSALGYYLIKLLRKKNEEEEIRALIHSSSPEHLKEFNLNLIKGDLMDSESLEKALENVDVVYHIAGEARENMPAKLYLDVNHLGTKNLLEAFVKNKGKKFLHVSSVGVYGYKIRKLPIDENFPKKSDHPYHTSKILGENEVFKYAKENGFFASAVRPPYIVGPRDRVMAPKLFEFLLKEKTIPLIKGGKAILSFVHHEDVARALILCGEKEKANGEAFNVVGDTIAVKDLFVTLGEIANKTPKFIKLNYYIAYLLGLVSEIIAKITRKKPKITRRRVNQFSVSRYYVTTKIEKLVGFKPKYTVKELLTDAFNWMKEVNMVD
ncbi:MAG: NAD-dependent epimerase/dehydratase family protein [Candidatus Heimdallarchaeaceae archaeon]